MHFMHGVRKELPERCIMTYSQSAVFWEDFLCCRMTDVFRSIEEKAEQELRSTTLRYWMDRIRGEIDRSDDK